MATNYSERRLLWILAWARRTFKTDPNRTYISGSSMGGCGTISFGMRHPEIFAAAKAHVPIVAYRHANPADHQRDSSFRVVGYCGPLEKPCSDGMPLGERLDGIRWVKRHPGDLPFLVITNGRRDGSIPWRPNPDYYRALDAGRHGFVAAWDNGTHGTCMKKYPPKFKRWAKVGGRLLRFALNKSYPAFSRCSKNDDPGDGRADNGDITGFMNVGFDWDDPIDRPDRYEVLVRWVVKGDAFPVTADVTPRRVQHFRPKPGAVVLGRNLDAATGKLIQSQRLRVDAHGLVTFVGFKIPSPAGARLILETRAAAR